MAQLLTVKKPSEELQDLISKVSNAFGKLQDTVNLVLKKGTEEGFTHKELGDMIREKMTNAGYSRMTMSRYLPSSAKHMEKSRTKSGNKMLPNTAKTFQFPGKIVRYSRGRHCIVISDKMDVKRFEGKALNVAITINQ